MDYSYRESPIQKEHRIVLNHNHLVYLSDGTLTMINYEDIEEVWLDRPSGFLAKGSHMCRIITKEGEEIRITPLNYEGEELIKQCDSYNYFLRILHKFLNEKGHASYYYGVPVSTYVLRIIIAILIITLTYIGLNNLPLSSWLVIGTGLSALIGTLFGFKFSVSKFPKVYTPDRLPIEVLPA